MRDERRGFGGRGVGQELEEALLLFRAGAGEYDLAVDQGGGGDHQAVGLEVAKPGLVIADGGILHKKG